MNFLSVGSLYLRIVGRLTELADLLLPVPEEELSSLLSRVQSRLCAELKAPASLLYIADATDSEHFRFEAGAGEAQDPVPREFRTGEGFLGQAVKEKRVLLQRVSTGLLGEAPLSALLTSEEVSLIAIPLIYQDQVEGLWVLASEDPNLPDTLQTAEWQDFLYKTATYLQSVCARRSIQALLEQSQLQNQELISREEELRQNLEELSVTQEEMRRTQKLLEERAYWQTVYNDLVNILLQNIASRSVFQSLSRVFTAQLAKHLDAKALIFLHWEDPIWKPLASWSSKKSPVQWPETWQFPPAVLQTLSKKNNETTVPAAEISLSPEAGDCILVPYLSPKRVEGLLLIVGSEASTISPDTRSKFLHDVTVAFFSSYERIQKLTEYLQGLLNRIAEASQAQVTLGTRAAAEKGELPWLDTIPILHRPPYVESLQQALKENNDHWIPPEELAAKEFIMFLGDSLMRLKW